MKRRTKKKRISKAHKLHTKLNKLHHLGLESKKLVKKFRKAMKGLTETDI